MARQSWPHLQGVLQVLRGAGAGVQTGVQGDRQASENSAVGAPKEAPWAELTEIPYFNASTYSRLLIVCNTDIIKKIKQDPTREDPTTYCLSGHGLSWPNGLTGLRGYM